MSAPPMVLRIAEACAAAGGRAWVVGGGVRDLLMDRPVKDWDLEVHGVSAQALERALARFGPSPLVGRSFGVYKVRAGGREFDVALPRAEGVPPERVSLQEALRRRDLTINAIAWDPLTGEREDPFGGEADIRARRLRAVDRETFLEDPCRVLRVVQFAARFGFAPDAALVELCRGAELGALPAERVMPELEKLLLGAPRPSEGLRLARALGALAQVLPDLDAAPAEPTDAAVDRAATRREAAGPEPRPLALMLAALLHTRSPAEVERVLDRLAVHTRARYPLRARVAGAVARWPELARPASDATLRRLAETEEVGLVAQTAWAATGEPCALEAEARAELLGVRWSALPPLLFGRDLEEIGVPAGPEMGRLLSLVREAQIQGTLCDPDQALSFVQKLVGGASVPTGR